MEGPGDPRIEIAEVSEHLEAEKALVEILVKNQEREKKYHQMLKADENTREKTECGRVKEHTAKEFELCRRLEIVIGTLVPIVAAIVMKAVYKRAAEISYQDQNIGGDGYLTIYSQRGFPANGRLGRCSMTVFLWHSLAAWKTRSKFPHFLFCPP